VPEEVTVQTIPLDSPYAAVGDAGRSQTVRAQLMLRELVLAGEFVPGERIPELGLVGRIGVSRTPVRMALLQLQQEGLLEALPAGGYTVKAFSEGDVHDAIELRGTLEGLAARLAAERGVGGGLWAEARDCVERIDELLAQPELTGQSFAAYVEQNGRFHAALAEMAASELVQRQVRKACTMPFASPNAFVLQRSTGPRARDILVIAQDQHRALLDAIGRREGARAEAIAREHARIAQHNLAEVLLSRQALSRMPGAGLIRRGGRR
jgi:GntR family transcriptional regulator, vanillate catabolism transcriptional regulator